MTFLACGTCQLSMLSNEVPFFEYWMWLLIPAFVVYHWQNKVGGIKGMTVVETCILAAVIVIGSAIMLAGLLLPLAWLGVLLMFTRRLFSRNRNVRDASIWMLLAFTLSAGFGLVRMNLRGEDYPFGRWQAGSPGHSFFSKQAQRDPFPAQHLADLYRTGDSRQANNVMGVFEARPGVAKDLSLLPAELALIRQLEGQRGDVSAGKLQDVIARYNSAIAAPSSP